MIHIDIGGVKYPIEHTLGAYREFKKETGKEVDQVSGISEMAELLYCFVKTTCRLQKVSFDMTCEEFCDNAKPSDIEILASLIGPKEEPEKLSSKTKKKD